MRDAEDVLSLADGGAERDVLLFGLPGLLPSGHGCVCFLAAAVRRRRRRQRKFCLQAPRGNICYLLPPQLPSPRVPSHQLRPRIRAGLRRVEASTEAARLWRMGSSASCLWGGSKSTADRTGQTVAASPRSGTFHSFRSIPESRINPHDTRNSDGILLWYINFFY